MTWLRTLFALILIPIFSSAQETEKPRVVLLMIGDGMGQEFLDMARESEQTRRQDPAYKLAMDALPVRTTMKTLLHGKYVTDSAASGTAIACGRHHHMNAVSVGQDKSSPLETVVDVAEAGNWKTGIISNMSLDDATPACFYAHAGHRNEYAHIARQLVDSPVDFFGGGGLKAVTSGEIPEWNTTATEAGFTLVRTPEDLEKQNPGTRILAVGHRLDPESGLLPAGDQTEKDLTLPFLLKEALRILENDQGIFMMVEGGKIDKAGHLQDETFALKETLEFDRTVKVALEYQAEHPEDTLVIVTSDHETGALTRTRDGFAFQHGRHSARDVPFMAIGPGSELFRQPLTNVELGQRLKHLVKPKAETP